jgi:hypothetical protein
MIQMQHQAKSLQSCLAIIFAEISLYKTHLKQIFVSVFVKPSSGAATLYSSLTKFRIATPSGGEKN